MALHGAKVAIIFYIDVIRNVNFGKKSIIYKAWKGVEKLDELDWLDGPMGMGSYKKQLPAWVWRIAIWMMLCVFQSKDY